MVLKKVPLLSNVWMITCSITPCLCTAFFLIVVGRTLTAMPVKAKLLQLK